VDNTGLKTNQQKQITTDGDGRNPTGHNNVHISFGWFGVAL